MPDFITSENLLVAITAVYAFLTWRMAKSTATAADAAVASSLAAKESAEAAKSSAESSERATEATQLATAVAAAQAGVSFDIETPLAPETLSNDGSVRLLTLDVRNTGQPTVRIHAIQAKSFKITDGNPSFDNPPFFHRDFEIQPLLNNPEQVATPSGQYRRFQLMPPILGDKGLRIHARAEVLYSFDGHPDHTHEYPLEISAGSPEPPIAV